VPMWELELRFMTAATKALVETPEKPGARRAKPSAERGQGRQNRRQTAEIRRTKHRMREIPPWLR
jgi:hypothetical protein